ncbi:MAG: DUF2834 domain-containing protein [Alteromonadaceae bacterium]|nr:DUF2834 domain-containing protein [Alteromonadaceae bacterium]
MTLALQARYAKVYLALAVVGFIVPFIPFVEWLLMYGIAPQIFWTQLTDNHISMFAWLDVVIAALVVYCVTFQWRQQLSHRALLSVILSTSLIGVSCGLPLLLYFISAKIPKAQGL